jgi:malonyl-CoA O-methyltransferase
LLPAALSGRAVLDAGCGSGRYLIHAQRRGAARVVGVDLSREMLARAAREIQEASAYLRTPIAHPCFLQGSVDAIPLRDGWADLTVCGLTLGHLAEIDAPLAELRRVTRRGGALLCSDFHPIGDALGWRREFSAGGRRYAVRHTAHTRDQWGRACRALDLEIVRVLEPRLDPADLPPGAMFDRAALDVPVALVFELRRA